MTKNPSNTPPKEPGESSDSGHTNSASTEVTDATEGESSTSGNADALVAAENQSAADSTAFAGEVGNGAGAVAQSLTINGESETSADGASETGNIDGASILHGPGTVRAGKYKHDE